jgi:hypothetical protein
MYGEAYAAYKANGCMYGTISRKGRHNRKEYLQQKTEVSPHF